MGRRQVQEEGALGYRQSSNRTEMVQQWCSYWSLPISSCLSRDPLPTTLKSRPAGICCPRELLLHHLALGDGCELWLLASRLLGERREWRREEAVCPEAGVQDPQETDLLLVFPFHPTTPSTDFSCTSYSAAALGRDQNRIVNLFHRKSGSRER